MRISELNFRLDENIAMALTRGLDGYENLKPWGELIATGQFIIGHYQELELEQFSDSEPALIAAARILDSASVALQASNEQSVAASLALVSATAYGMLGNFPSAYVMVKRFMDSIEPSESQLAVIGTCAPKLIPQIITDFNVNPSVRTYLESLDHFLRSGNIVNGSLEDKLIECILSAQDSFSSACLRSSRTILRQIQKLALVPQLSIYRDILPENYIKELIDGGISLLMPPQHHIIESGSITNKHGNILISIPTSTGKTLLGEIAILSSLRRSPGLVCYIVPYVAIGRQVARSLNLHLPLNLDYRLHRLFGGFATTSDLDPETHREVVVATPERFDALLRSSEIIRNNLRAVVIDEAHMIVRGQRGMRLEGLIARLRLMQKNGNSLRLFLLSAVINNTSLIQKWLDIPNENVLRDTWHPTARRIAVWKQSGRLTWTSDLEDSLPASYQDKYIGQRILPWPNSNLYPADHEGVKRAQRPKSQDNVAYLVDYWLKKHGGPILCVCSTKANTRGIARAIGQKLEKLDPIPPKVENTLRLIEEKYNYLHSLFDLLLKGVAYHNSSLPHDLRSRIEDAVESQGINVIVATTTLAEGVNLPFRATIIADWLLWSSAGEQPMDSLLFRNIAGRCGRAGIFSEGDTIIYDNVIGNYRYTKNHLREQARDSILQSPSLIRSAIEQEQGDDWKAIQAAFSSQLLAAIPENPDIENIAEVFKGSLFSWYSKEKPTETNRLLDKSMQSILDEEQGPLAQAASPLQLTDLGRAINMTGFSPQSGREILSLLNQLPKNLSEDELISHLLAGLSKLPEQSQSYLSRVFRPSSRLPVKPDDIGFLAKKWLSGENMIDMFIALPAVKRSKRKPTLDEWLKGEKEGESWDDWYDKFVDILIETFQNFLPWVLRACYSLSTASQLETASNIVDWRKLAESFERREDDFD